MKKMVICGASGLNNSGDEAILEVLLHQYQKHYDVTVISLNPENTERYHENAKCIALKDRDLCCKVLKEADVFLLGGGGLFQDETSIFNVFRWANILKLAIKYVPKSIVYANSIGPLRYRTSRQVVKKLLNKVDYITVRDQNSMRLAKRIGVTTPIQVTADPVFNFPLEKQNVESFELPSKYVVFAVRHWYDMIPFVPSKITNKLNYHSSKYDEYIASLNEIVEYINVHLDLPVVFLSFYTNRDYKVAKDIVEHQKNSKHNIILGDGRHEIMPKEMMQVIKNSEFLVGMRLHSLIYATKCLTPYIAISYSSKVKGLLKDLKMQKYSIFVDELTLERFCEKYELLKQDSDILKKLDLSLQEMVGKENINYEITVD